MDAPDRLPALPGAGRQRALHRRAGAALSVRARRGLERRGTRLYSLRAPGAGGAATLAPPCWRERFAGEWPITQPGPRFRPSRVRPRSANCLVEVGPLADG